MTTPENFSLLARLLDFEVFLPLLITGGVVISVIVKAVAGTVATLSRERTRREIAAYIAEGAMTPEQGERLMRAEPKDRGSMMS